MKKASVFDLYHDISRLSDKGGKTYGATLSEGLQRINTGFFALYPNIFNALFDRFEK